MTGPDLARRDDEARRRQAATLDTQRDEMAGVESAAHMTSTVGLGVGGAAGAARLSSTLESLQADLSRLAAAYSDHTRRDEPARHAAIDRDQQAELRRIHHAHGVRAAQVTLEQSEWSSEEGPRLRAEIEALEQQAHDLQRQTDETLAAIDTLESTVTRIDSLCVASRAREASLASGLCVLPVSLLVRVVSFVSRRELARLSRVSFGLRECIDRGALWRPLAIELVRTVLAAHQATSRAAEARRRQLGGLTQDFHTSNFLATRPNNGTPSPTPSNGGRSTTSSSSPSSSASPPPLPPNASSEINVVIPSRADPPVRRAAGQVTIPKVDLFERAVNHLQSQVDPALGDFEDLSIKIASHQRIVQFLQVQIDHQHHQLGLANLTLGDSYSALEDLSHAKDDLAREMYSIDVEVARERAAQAEITRECEEQLRQLKAQSNLRRNVDHLMQHAAAAEETNDYGNPFADAAPATPAPRAPPADQSSMLSAISLLKQQKKVLVKAVKSMQVESAAVREERDEYARKMEALRQQLQGINIE